MRKQPVEAILIRRLAGCLSVPVALFDLQATAIYYNAAAERVLGERFDELGPIPVALARELFDITDRAGRSIAEEQRPVFVALRERRAGQARIRLVQRRSGACVDVELTVFPVIGQGGAMHGVVAMFWESDRAG